MIYAIIVGGSNVAFYKQLKAAGVDLSKQTLLTISVTEDEIGGIGGENIAGAFACMKYFQSLDNPNNQAFVADFDKMYGKKSVIGDVTQAAYLGPWLWKLSAETAGSFDIDLSIVHFLSGPVGVEGAEPGELLVVDFLDIGAFPHDAWGFNGFFSKKNGGGFLTDHFPQAQKSI